MTTAADPKIFPAPRKRGAGVALDELSGPIVAPRSRLFPFHFTWSASSRHSFSTPRLTPPIILKSIFYQQTQSSSPPQQSLEIGIAHLPVYENGVALATPKPYSIITELLNRDSGMPAVAGQGFPFSTLTSGTNHWQRQLDYVITEPDVYLVIAHCNNNVQGAELTGYLTLLEAVDAETIRFFH